MCQVTNFTKTCKMWHFTNFTKSDNKHEMCQVTNLYKVWNVNMLQTLHTTWQICTKCELCKVCMHEHDNKHEMSTCYKLYKKCQLWPKLSKTCKMWQQTRNVYSVKCVQCENLQTHAWLQICTKCDMTKTCKMCQFTNLYKVWIVHVKCELCKVCKMWQHENCQHVTKIIKICVHMHARTWQQTWNHKLANTWKLYKVWIVHMKIVKNVMLHENCHVT